MSIVNIFILYDWFPYGRNGRKNRVTIFLNGQFIKQVFNQIESKVKIYKSKKISSSQSIENDPEPWKCHSDK